MISKIFSFMKYRHPIEMASQALVRTLITLRFIRAAQLGCQSNEVDV
jgi:hypothetical protein